MDFHLLGPFEARVDGRSIPVGTRRQERLLLATLLLDADRIVPIDRLIDVVWEGFAPPSARSTVHTYMGRLRHTLRPYQVRIVTRRDGYLIEAAGQSIDTVEFVDLAHRAAVTLDPSERVLLLDQALGMWRGPLLADLAEDELRHRLGAQLIELRLSSAELRAEAWLPMGRHDLAVADLTGLAEQHPTRERLLGLLMTALYRSARQADAIELYLATRKILVAELGVEPGPELQALHLRILRNDPDLDRPPAPPYAVRVRDQWLPWQAAGHPALEFCNTFAGWGWPAVPGGEWLRSYQTLAVWSGYVGLADQQSVTRVIEQAQREPGAAAAVLAQARVLRQGLYSCLTTPGDAAAFALVARFAEAAARESTFVEDPDGLGRWRLAESAGLRMPLYAAARSGAELLADPRRYTVRRCPGVDCGWLFLNQGELRQWCSLGICGMSATADAARHPACI